MPLLCGMETQNDDSVDPQIAMNSLPLLLLTTSEVMFTIVVPLIVLYLRGAWALRTKILCLLILPVVWYFTYAPLHELSHILGTYLIGGHLLSMRLIPPFWRGEFGRAWINSEGVTEGWQQLVSTGFPYLLDVLSLVAGLMFLRRRSFRSPFILGLAFMLLCLRPLFDLVCETGAFILGDRGDIYWINRILGSALTWTFLISSIGLSLVTISVVLTRFISCPSD